MAADCLWCLVGSGSIANPIQGATENPLGCCHRCQAFACGNHAQYDYLLHEYVCYNCDVNGIIKSAEELDATGRIDSTQWRGSQTAPKFSGQDIHFPSYDNLKKRRPGYNNWFTDIDAANVRILSNKNPDNYFGSMNIESKKLYIAAAFILYKMGGDYNSAEASGYPAFISILQREFTENGGWSWN